MDRHNRQALELFVDYVRCYVAGLGAEAREPRQVALPLSGIRLPVAPAEGASAAGWRCLWSMLSMLRGQQQPATQCLSFDTRLCCDADGSEVDGAAAPATAGASALRRWLASLRVAYSVCSPFAALSGRGDEFSSLEELVGAVREGVLLDVAGLPTVIMFDRHGQVRAGVGAATVSACASIPPLGAARSQSLHVLQQACCH